MKILISHSQLPKYLRTRFARFLLDLAKINQHETGKTYQFVPVQDFSIAWTDEALYAKYRLTEEEIAVLREKARTYIPARVKYYSERMGLFPSAVKISSAAARFGSCSAKNSLNFSYRLMQYPAEAIDYVVVHELAHIKHHNHGKEFYALIGQYLPDYKKRIEILKQ